MSNFSFIATGFETWDGSSGIENLPPRVNRPGLMRLSQGENIRFTSEGGVQNRLGFQQKADLGTSAKVDYMRVHPDLKVLFTKSGTKIQQSTDGATWYDIGLTQTAGEATFLFPEGKNMFATNQTDSFTRIAVSTVAAVDSGANTLSVRTGDGVAFASGTIYVRGVQVTGGTLSGDDYTGLTGLTAAMQVGDIVTQTSTPTGAPKGRTMASLQGHALVGGTSTVGTTLHISLPSNPDEPELFYEFRTAQGATQKTMPSNITALWGGKGGVLIGMESGIDVALDFNDSLGGALITRSVSRVHSVPNQFCIADMGEKLVVLTTEGRVIPIQDTDSGFIIIEDEEVPQNNWDYPISKYIRDNKDGTDNSQNWIYYDPAKKLVYATILMKSGITETFVRQRDEGGWSVDTSKNYSCMVTLKDRVYAGSDNDDKIYLDDELRTDAGVPIISRMVTGILTLDKKRITGDWLDVIVGGLLSHPGQFTFRIAMDGDQIDERVITSDELIDNRLMTTTSGVFIGGGNIGSEAIGSAGNLTEAYTFTFPYEFLAEGESSQIEIEVMDESTAMELRDLKVLGESEGELLIPHL